ncbi:MULTISPECIES: hypothetical protein [Tenebrionibacter/Tenebrionicola group]|jgi:hypothetical protein|uniref:Uncharacterized protein n=2 Tax=Tenebrionibacter/Tenebrionicola group TaxID=2969848 RepID=A0A8K0UZP1_9ENTR|nr:MULTISPECIES: hypothetical protein [Tenebrionibacter/Tenebrionicola group]MBK4713813.1 hypothetical protein [Tenebrionibacter intestinalis]MBV5094694.1 hypothetical protein [Tenebrionicola larvae]
MLRRKCPALNTFIIFLLLANCAALSVGILFVDVLCLHNHVGEISVTEFTQEALLLACAALWLRSALKTPALRGGCILIAGFYAALLIRELDYYFDAIYHGAWLWFALITTAAALWFARRWRHSVLPGLNAFTRHPASGYTLCGLVTILIFSRLFGMSAFWQTLLGDNYVMAVKTAIEEGTELMGYTLCLFSSVWFCPGLKTKTRALLLNRPAPLQEPLQATENLAYCASANPIRDSLN